MEESKDHETASGVTSVSELGELSTASANFDSTALSSRYSAEVEDEQQRQEQERQQQPEQNDDDEDDEDKDLEPDEDNGVDGKDEKVPAQSDNTGAENIFKARDSFHNVDQTVNLMDVNAAKYENDDSDQTPRASSNKPVGEESTFMEALMGDGDDQKASSGWNKTPKADKYRRKTWDTSIVGRLTIWLVFFGTMFVVTFLIPYLLKQDDIRKAAEARAAASAPMTEAPTPFNGMSRKDNIKTVILQNAISTERALDDHTSDAFYAWQWISDIDPVQVEPRVNHHDNTELLQRYALAIFYYAAHPGVDAKSHSAGAPKEQVQHMQPHGDQDGAAGAPAAANNEGTVQMTQEVHLTGHPVTPPPQLEQEEAAAFDERDGAEVNPDDPSVVMMPRVVSVHMSREDRESHKGSRRKALKLLATDGTPSSWIQDDGWMSSTSVCEWYGITCDSAGYGIVQKVVLPSNNLKGTIPVELQALSKLVALDISENHLTGIIPVLLWKHLPQLQSLKANQNKISGSIPSDVGLMSKLQEIDLSHNSLRFDLPTELAKLLQLKILRLEGNRLTGAIPSLVNSTELSVLRLGSNQFTGALPYHIYMLRKLADLGLQSNSFQGTFPPEIDSLKSLQYLDLSNNQITGRLSEVFSRLQHLKSLNLQGNQLQGNLPTSMGLLGRLGTLDLSNNGLEGQIPVEWTGMTNLERLEMTHNRLTGTIPARMFRLLTSMKSLRLDHNVLKGTLSEHLGKLTLLQNLTLSANSFRGSIPSELVALTLLKTLELTATDLTGSIPPEVCMMKLDGPLTFVTANCRKVQCSCCDNCDPQADHQ
ncbi:LRR receptor-like serine threonine-protein kinase At4g08850-like [Seminavis robusta]|uniref:LRR receptor-like serine threonine-protein kinase At4g08850-like n=1 Tax=Seminavis robusta TaxID=568900 RepID=A0A9N8HHJ7_9STRA|nr:LRR receptor-like serine threonine-protein kinase At4g08850-like [Seminavis robusta]|eukprot:Sro566_g167830.1 LRR receptor-like serine threonine-protein kinase At4g08850-like (820) ;mRNA; f:32330-35308